MGKPRMIDMYHVSRHTMHGTGREGDRWSADLLVGTSKVATINCDGDGGCLRWTWKRPTNARTGPSYESVFQHSLDEWIQGLVPGTTSKDYIELDSTWVMASMISGGVPDVRDNEAMKSLYGIPKPLTRAPNWITLENRLSRLLHTMKLGYSQFLSLDYPFSDLMRSQRLAISTVEEWMKEECIDVDNWQLLDGALGGVNLGPWCAYNAENYTDELKLGFSTFGDVTKWKDIVPKPHILVVYHREPTYEKES